MSEFAALQRVGLALAIGLLIGIERGWQQREIRDGARAAGVHTYTLIGLLGGIWGLLSTSVGPSVLGFAVVAFALPFAYFEWQQMQLEKSVSATGLIGGLLTFALGAYAVRGSMAIAAAASVGATVILAERRILHDFLQRLKWIELRAALQLLIMTVVLLPALPDRTIDPWNALNPHQIWLMTVLIAGVSYAGYISIKLAGERKGLLYAGALGGLITSTTVTWTFARLAKRDPTAQSEVMAAILAAWIVSLLRMTAIAVVIAPALAAPLIPPIGLATLVLLVPGLISYRASAVKTSSASPRAMLS